MRNEPHAVAAHLTRTGLVVEQSRKCDSKPTGHGIAYGTGGEASPEMAITWSKVAVFVTAPAIFRSSASDLPDGSSTFGFNTILSRIVSTAWDRLAFRSDPSRGFLSRIR
jgi:hypothetical protein